MKDVKEKTLDVTKKGKVVPFERDAGYYLKKGMFNYQNNKLDKALLFFQRAVAAEPLNPYNHYNLACLLSKLGRLKEANKAFLHIVNALDSSMTDCYFLLAINYGLLEDLDKSREYLQRYLQVEPDGEMSFEAAELLDAMDEDFVYDNLPAYTEKDVLLERVLSSGESEELDNLYATNAGFRKALNNRLYHVSDEFKEDILRFYGGIGGKDAEKVLLSFVKNPWIKERFRQLALLELKNYEINGMVQVFLDGKLKEVDLACYPIRTPVWQKEWQNVVDRAVENMRHSNCYDEGFFDDVQAIWLDYINTVYPETPVIKKVETWAAALEYSLARFHYLDLTQKELAKEYQISPASISGKFKEINSVLFIDEKAYKNMVAYLKKE